MIPWRAVSWGKISTFRVKKKIRGQEAGAYFIVPASQAGISITDAQDNGNVFSSIRLVKKGLFIHLFSSPLIMLMKQSGSQRATGLWSC